LERYGLDFGYSVDPTAIVAVYYWNGAYILDEVLFQKGIGNKEIADFLKNQDRAMVVADSAEPKSIDEIKRYGINITGSVKGKDSVRNGIQLIQDQRIFYTRSSSNLKKAYDNYLWRTDRDGKLISPNEPDHYLSDCMDAVRYGMITLVHNIEELNDQDFSLYTVAYN
jgi:phage terminase large subunit